MDSNHNENRNKKFLILSLGTGVFSGSDNHKIPSYPYKSATYRYIGENGSTKVTSPFVAEALIDVVKPDKILIIGTVKSAWDAFYYRYHGNDIKDYVNKWEELKEKISHMGKTSTDNEIIELQDYVNNLYNDEVVIPGDSSIDICIIKYGLNDEEMTFTYRKINDCLKRVIEEFEINETIEISFDITHSFRSLPLYNLVLIDYFRLISQRRISIQHVFYGNLDVAKENDDIAEIIDLKGIIDVGDRGRFSVSLYFFILNSI